MQALSEDPINILAVCSSGYVSCLWSLNDGSQSNREILPELNTTQGGFMCIRKQRVTVDVGDLK